MSDRLGELRWSAQRRRPRAESGPTVAPSGRRLSGGDLRLQEPYQCVPFVLSMSSGCDVLREQASRLAWRLPAQTCGSNELAETEKGKYLPALAVNNQPRYI